MEGCRYLKEAADTAGDDVAFLMDTANLLFDVEQYQTAAEYYNRVVNLKPGHGDALNNLANCYFKSGDLEQAAETYQCVLSEFPGYLLACRNLGLTYFKLDQSKKALFQPL